MLMVPGLVEITKDREDRSVITKEIGDQGVITKDREDQSVITKEIGDQSVIKVACGSRHTVVLTGE